MKALMLMLAAWCVHGRPTTIVNFSPVGNSPGVAPGFAYAFRAPALIPPHPNAPVDDSTAGTSEDPATVIKTQYHSQDQLGQYAFGYVGAASTAHETRTMDGAVRGSYTYLDANGELQTATYVADENGFRVEATNLPQLPNAAAVVALPQPVQLTPEVQAATDAHLAAIAKIKAARPKR